MSIAEKLADRTFWTDCLPLARKMLTIVALSLALDRAEAGEPITGSISDENINVEWTYDLEANSGQIIISADQTRYFGYGDLVPEGATNVFCSGVGCFFDECLACVSATPCPETIVFGYAKFTIPLAIGFDLPAPSWQKTIGESEFEYFNGNLLSAGACSLYQSHSIEGFVTVVPLSTATEKSDLDKDGDVDLHDYKLFQADFTGPNP